jgi:hypothetical protein
MIFFGRLSKEILRKRDIFYSYLFWDYHLPGTGKAVSHLTL